MAHFQRSMFEQQQRNILQLSMNNYGQIHSANTIQKIQIKDIQQKPNHIAYRILTMFSGSNRKTKHVNSTRRYSDFQKLHLYFKSVVGKSTPLLLPKLPSKHGIQDYMEFWEDSKMDFFNERKEDLEIYLKLLVESEVIRESPILKEFLEEGQIDKLEEEISKANLNIPSSAPEKAYLAIKKTFNSVKNMFENFNAPVLEIDPSLKSKIEKIEKIKATMVDLLTLELQRSRCLKIKQKELTNLKSDNGGFIKGLTQTLKQKILSSVSYQSPQNTTCLPCIQKLYNYIEMKFKEEKSHVDKMDQMKKIIKTMIFRCDSVLEHFDEIISEKGEVEKMGKRLLEFDKMVEGERYVQEGVRVLHEYSGYYQAINKVSGGEWGAGRFKLDQVEEEEDEGEFN